MAGSQIAQNGLEPRVYCVRVGQGYNPLVLGLGRMFSGQWIFQFRQKIVMLCQHVVVVY